MEDDSQVRLWPKVRLRILCFTLEALLVEPLPGGVLDSFHRQKPVLGPEHTGLQAFWPTPLGFSDPALLPASLLMYLSFYQHRVSAVGYMRQVIVKRLRRDNRVEHSESRRERRQKTNYFPCKSVKNVFFII